MRCLKNWYWYGCHEAAPNRMHRWPGDHEPAWILQIWAAESPLLCWGSVCFCHDKKGKAQAPFPAGRSKGWVRAVKCIAPWQPYSYSCIWLQSESEEHAYSLNSQRFTCLFVQCRIFGSVILLYYNKCLLNNQDKLPLLNECYYSINIKN